MAQRGGSAVSVGILGHGSGKSATVAGKVRETEDPMSQRNKIASDSKMNAKEVDTKTDDSDEMIDAINSLGLDSNEITAVTPI